jgi:hypothetical protein
MKRTGGIARAKRGLRLAAIRNLDSAPLAKPETRSGGGEGVAATRDSGRGRRFGWMLFCLLILGLLCASAVPVPGSRYIAAAVFLLLAGSALALPLEFALWALAVGILNGSFIGKMIFGGEGHVSAAPFPLETIMALLAFVRLAWKWESPLRFAAGFWYWIAVLAGIELWLTLRADDLEALRPTIGMICRVVAFCLVCFRFGRSFGPEAAHRFIATIGVSLAAPAINYYFYFRYAADLAGNIEQARSTSLLGDPNVLALLWSMGAALAISLIRIRGRFWKMVALGSFPLMALGVVSAGSRTGAIVFCAGLLAWVCARPRFGLILLPVAGGLAVWLFLAAPAALQTRLLDLNAFERSRGGAFKSGADTFLQNPWIGMGRNYHLKDTSTAVLGAHNSILEAAATGGVIYLFAYTGFLVYLVVVTLGEFRRRNSLLTEANLVVVVMYLVGAQGLSMAGLSGGEPILIILGGVMLTRSAFAGIPSTVIGRKRHIPRRSGRRPAAQPSQRILS